MSDVMISTSALTKRFGDVQALDQVEFSGRFAHMIRQAAKGVTRILRSGCRTPR